VLAWLDNANKSLDDAPPVYGNPKQIETELSKLKVKKLPFYLQSIITSLLIIRVCYVTAYAASESESLQTVILVKLYHY